MDQDEKDVRLTDTNGGSQKCPIINESRIYVLILRIPTPATGAKSPVFAATDVCRELGIKNTSDAVSKNLDDDDRGIASIYTPSGD